MEQRLEGKIDAAIDRLRTEMIERIRESETSLLTELSNFALGNRIHFKEIEARFRAQNYA